MANEDVLRQLAEVAADLGPAIRPGGHDEMLQSIVSAARRLFGAVACSMALLDDRQEHLIFHVADGRGAEEVVGRRIPTSEGIAGFVVRSGMPLAIEDVRRDPRFAGAFAEDLGYLPTRIIAVPLETERDILGVIEILDPEETSARGQEMEIVGLFAQQAALAIEGSRVFTDLGRTMLAAIARAAGESAPGVAQALDEVAEASEGPDPELAELAALFAELRELGPEEQRTAARLLALFTTYAHRARRMG
jgi:GAF domain-containing protein